MPLRRSLAAMGNESYRDVAPVALKKTGRTNEQIRNAKQLRPIGVGFKLLIGNHLIFLQLFQNIIPKFAKIIFSLKIVNIPTFNFYNRNRKQAVFSFVFYQPLFQKWQCRLSHCDNISEAGSSTFPSYIIRTITLCFEVVMPCNIKPIKFLCCCFIATDAVELWDAQPNKNIKKRTSENNGTWRFIIG